MKTGIHLLVVSCTLALQLALTACATDDPLRQAASNERARNGLLDLEQRQRHAQPANQIQQESKNNQTAAAAEQLRVLIAEQPANPATKALAQELNRKTTQPTNDFKSNKGLQKTLSITFKDAMLRQVFEVLSRTSSINFVFDKDVRSDQKVTIFLNGTSVKDAIDVVLFTNQLEQRWLDANTILIYPSTPAKLKDYQALTVRGFFLSNADPEQVASALKSLLKMKDVIVDKRQSLITVRDTADGVKMAEKLVALYDLPEPEVMLDVEILEINRNRLTELGIRYPNQLSLMPLSTTGGNTLTLRDLKDIHRGSVGVTVSPLVIDAKNMTADINLLANPRIRARNRDTAKILIGDKVPNITTTSTSTGFVASNVQYLDVGLKLEVVPTITADNEVAIKISLEVSNIANQITTAEGTVAYQIGTRSASTVLRLKDGENQVLAGLISDEDRRSANKVPGLGDIPMLGRLFGSNLRDGRKTEIVLSITPRLVRSNLRPDMSVMEFESGTETNMRGLGAFMQASEAGTLEPASGASAVAVPAPSDKALTLPAPAAADPSSSSSSAPDGTITAAWSAPSEVKAGSTFSINLTMNTAQPVTAVPLAIGYNPAKLEIVDVREGDLLAQNGGKTNFSHRVDRNSGQVFVTTARSQAEGPNGTSGAGTVLTLTARALASSTAEETAIRVITLAPLGLTGAAVPATPPAPLRVNVTP